MSEETTEKVSKPTTKDELVNCIKEWVSLENDISKLKADMKDKATKKKKLTESLVSIMKTNNINCFDIKDGSLVYKQRKTKQTITGKFLLAQLEEYYKDNPDMAKDIAKKVLDNRAEVVKDELKISPH
jgi:hypothetical protein